MQTVTLKAEACLVSLLAYKSSLARSRNIDVGGIPLLENWRRHLDTIFRYTVLKPVSYQKIRYSWYRICVIREQKLMPVYGPIYGTCVIVFMLKCEEANGQQQQRADVSLDDA